MIGRNFALICKWGLSQSTIRCSFWGTQMKNLLGGGLRRTATAALLALILSVNSFGESSSTSVSPSTANPDSGGSVTEAVKAPASPDHKFFGTLDMRAEYYSMTGTYDTSNFIQFGYQFNPDVKVSYYQGFDSNVSGASLYGVKAQGLNPIWDQGFLRTRVANIYKNGGFSINYENRIYMPTLPLDINSGNVTRIYNAIKFVEKVSDMVTLTAVEVVSPQIYKVAGTDANGPNPWYENRVYLVADFQFTDKLSLDLPILMYQDKYRNYGTSDLSGNWGWIVYTWPELDYAINDNVTVGLAFVSDNWVAPDLSSITIGHAFRNADFQFIVTLSM